MTKTDPDKIRHNPHKNRRPHVVVVGGGFGGLTAVRGLKKADVDVTLIDKNSYNVFQPLLYQVATASLNPGDITWFLRAVHDKQSNVRFRRGKVIGIDTENQVLKLKGARTLGYDYLILAAGVGANFFGIPGAREYAYPLYVRSQAISIRDRIFASFEEAAINDPDADLRFVVVGGGATGVETAGALAEMRNIDLPVTYPELDRNRIHITLIERAPHVLAPFEAQLRDYAAEQLIKRDIDLRLNTAVKEVTETGVLVETDGKELFLPARLVIWASGVTTHETVNGWNMPQGQGGRIIVDDFLSVEGVDNVFAVGDAAVNPDNPLPQLAQPALQGGQYVARRITALVKGETLKKPFRYIDKGTMATIGRASAIAEVTGLPPIKGFPAWAMWVGIHVAQLLGNRNRLATMTNLSQKYLGWRSHNLIVGDAPAKVLKKPKLGEGGKPTS